MALRSSSFLLSKVVSRSTHSLLHSSPQILLPRARPFITSTSSSSLCVSSFYHGDPPSSNSSSTTPLPATNAIPTHQRSSRYHQKQQELQLLHEHGINPPVRKVRPHVNPLQAYYQIPLQITDNWVETHYTPQNVQQPFVIDVGCAEGGFTIEYAKQNPSLNVLGLEIRRPVVDICLAKKLKNSLHNVHFFPANANIDLVYLLQSLRQRASPIPVQMIMFQFPDPHFKKRNKKRRVVNPSLVRGLARELELHFAKTKQRTKIFVQTDVEDLANDMVYQFNSTPWYSAVKGYYPGDEQLSSNPSPNNVMTEREKTTLRRDMPVYRMLFERNDVPFDDHWKREEEIDDSDDEANYKS